MASHSPSTSARRGDAIRDHVPGWPWNPRSSPTAALTDNSRRRAAEAAVRAAGAMPATIAVLAGRPKVGLTDAELADLAGQKAYSSQPPRSRGGGRGGRTAATTVRATMALADRAGIRVFATGGIGGAHRVRNRLRPRLSTFQPTWSNCPGRRWRSSAPGQSILDIPRTLEIIETFGVR